MPKEVRLKPCAKDPYAWKVLPGKEEFSLSIFSKNLSNHSISTYRMLCREVGKSFEAVPSCSRFSVPDTLIHVCAGWPTVKGVCQGR